MKIKIKLSIMMIAIVLVIAGGIAIIELIQASNIAMSLAKQKTMYLARQSATYWNGRTNDFLNVLESVSDIMNRYESVEAGKRREQYEEIMLALFEDQPDFVRLFTIWKPNALDGMDARYIGRPGSTNTGQFAYALTRETGQITVITSIAVPNAMEMMNGPAANKTNVSHPTSIKLSGKDAYCIRIMVPIFNKRINEVVGVVGCQLNIDLVQPQVMTTVKQYDEVSAMSVYSSNGFILGSYQPERIGKMMIDAEVEFGKYVREALMPLKPEKNTSASVTPLRSIQMCKSPWLLFP